MIGFRFDLPVLELNLVPQLVHFAWLNNLGPRAPPQNVNLIGFAKAFRHDGQGALDIALPGATGFTWSLPACAGDLYGFSLFMVPKFYWRRFHDANVKTFAPQTD